MILTCTKCKQEKEDTEFYNNRTMARGKTYWCKVCSNYQSNLVGKEKKAEWSAKTYHKNKSKESNIKSYLIKYAKARSSRKGLEFSITVEDIILPEVCPILGIPFNRNTRRYGYSLDRKDPTKGYIKDNIWVVSQIANAMKWDSTREERIAFANWVLYKENREE